jgi:hypothetical protein
MANPTTNYGFVLPTSSDLVTDLPADFDVALQGVDTRLKALQPGTTEGDLAYSSATADTNTRLPIGTTGQILTVTDGVPTWASPSGGSVSGVSLYKANNSMPNGTYTNFSGFTENYDSGSFYTSGTDIVIPTAGKYLIQYVVSYDPNASGYRDLSITKNGSSITAEDFGNATAASFNRPYGTIIRAFTFAVDDELKFRSYQNSGSTLTANAWVTITFLGA